MPLPLKISLYYFLSPCKSANLTKECRNPPPGTSTCFRYPVETSSPFSPAGPHVLRRHGSSHADQGTGSVTDKHLLMATAIKLCNAGSLTAVHSPGAENDARREERDLKRTWGAYGGLHCDDILIHLTDSTCFACGGGSSHCAAVGLRTISPGHRGRHDRDGRFANFPGRARCRLFWR